MFKYHNNIGVYGEYMEINLNPTLEREIRLIVVDMLPRHGAITRIVEEALLLWLERRTQEMILKAKEVHNETNNSTIT